MKPSYHPLLIRTTVKIGLKECNAKLLFFTFCAFSKIGFFLFGGVTNCPFLVCLHTF